MADRPLYAVILAGGAAKRLSGVDKPMLPVEGKPLLLHVLDAVAAAAEIVVVGPRRAGVGGVRWAREVPAGGGPIAALGAGLAALPETRDADIAVLAADLPGVHAATISRLRSAMHEATADGAMLMDSTGRRQWLTGVWNGAALQEAMPADPVGRSARSILGALRAVDVVAQPGEAVDVDTPADVARVRAGAQARPSQRSHR